MSTMEEEVQDGQKVDVLERLAGLEHDLQMKTIRADEPGIYAAQLETARDAIREIQQLRSRLERIHEFTDPKRVGSWRRPIIGYDG